MNYPPIRDEIERGRHRGGCGIVCLSIAGAAAITASVGIVARSGLLPLSHDAVLIVAFINAALAAAGSAVGGWGSEEDVFARAVMGLIAGAGGLWVYTVAAGIMLCAGLI